jgi:hypothetical protein
MACRRRDPRLVLSQRLLAEGAVEAAALQVRALLDAEPECADALCLEGEIALRSGRARKASQTFAAVVARGASGADPLTAAHSGLGAALLALGDLAGSVEPLTAAVAAAAADGRAWRLLAEALFATGARESLGDLAARAVATETVDPLVAAAVAIAAALAAYVAGDGADCRSRLGTANRVLAVRANERSLRGLQSRRRLLVRRALDDPTERIEWSTVVYAAYLAQLLAFRDAHRDVYEAEGLPKLHVIGDSHALSPAHTRVRLGGRAHGVRPHLVIGAKAWHLAAGLNPGPSPQRAAFERALASIPDGATVVAAFGEIDCRVDEGLFPYLEARPEVDTEAYIRCFAAAYAEAVVDATAARRQRLLLAGTPAPVRRRAEAAGERLPAFVSVVRRFNKALADAARAKGCAFLDPFALSAGADGLDHGRWHLDDTHLRPDALAATIRAAGLDQ